MKEIVFVHRAKYINHIEYNTAASLLICGIFVLYFVMHNNNGQWS